eukprot:scaffold127878_cov14-Tisochrysis_lutea.AAC.1
MRFAGKGHAIRQPIDAGRVGKGVSHKLRMGPLRSYRPFLPFCPWRRALQASPHNKVTKQNEPTHGTSQAADDLTRKPLQVCSN